MSGIIYQYQQAYMPANGNTFHFWVDCSKEIYEEEAAEGGTVRLLYSAPAFSLAELVPDECTLEIAKTAIMAEGWTKMEAYMHGANNMRRYILRNVEDAK